MTVKDWIGLGLILLSVVIGIYFGVWVCFIGGIIQIFSNFDPLNFVQIGWGLVKFLFSSIVGWASFLILFTTGVSLIKK